jgi:ribosome-binding protein aMBF1 (putative translation factor)
MFMMIKPHYMKIGSEEMVVLSVAEYEQLAKKADLWEPTMPAADEDGNYPVEALDILMAQGILRARRKLGLTQADLARRAGIRVTTLERIEHGEIAPNERAIDKIDRALQAAQNANGSNKAKQTQEPLTT